MTDLQPDAGTTTHATARRWRPRHVVIAAVAAAVLAVLACEVSGWRFLRGPLQNVLQKAIGAPVRLDGRFRLHLLWRPNVQVADYFIGAAPGFDAPYLVDATAFRLDWRWLDIWRTSRGAPLRLEGVQADKLQSYLVRLADGRASWQLGQPQKAQDQAKAANTSGLPQVGMLNIGDGAVHLADAVTRTKLLITVRGGEGAIRGKSVQQAAEAGFTLTAKGQFRDLPLDLQARVGGALPLVQESPSGGAAPLVPVHVEGSGGQARLWFDGGLAALTTARRVSGDLRFSGPSLAAVGEPLGLTLPRTPAFDLRGHLTHDGNVWELKAERATIGDSQLAGDFRFDSNPMPPKLSGQLRGQRLLLADLGPAVGTAGAGTKDDAKPRKGDKVLPEREFDLPSLRGMDADVQVAIDLLDLGTTALAPLRQLQTHVLLQGGVLRLDDMKAVVAGGNVSGNTQLDARNDPARWAAKLHFDRVDLAGWVTGVRKAPDAAAGGASAPSSAPAAAARDAKTLKQERQAAHNSENQPVKAYLTGELTGNVNVTGQGRSTAQILGTLDGSADASLRDGSMSHLLTELAGLDVAQALGVLVKGDSPLALRCARVDMVVQQGVAIARQAVLDNRDSTLRVGGHIDLRTESLDLRAVTKPKDISPLTLRAPVLVRGTLSKPSVGIEARALTGRAAAAAALAVVATPVAAMLPFIDFGDKSEGDPCAPLPVAAAGSAAAASRAQATGQVPQAQAASGERKVR